MISEKKHYQLIIIGGGPAGMACAASAKKAGLKDILILERRAFLGGILKQCVHDGFGLLSTGESLTGPEFSKLLEKEISGAASGAAGDAASEGISGATGEESAGAGGVRAETQAYVAEINYDASPYEVQYISKEGRIVDCTCLSVVLATGCKERSFGSLEIPGTRPAGIYSAGSAQYMMNVQNILPGRSVVILGFGDIGMIMARRITLEGGTVKLIAGAEMTGLQRNFHNCVESFGIPYKVNYTVVSVHGYKRLKGVTIAPLDENGRPVMEKKEYVYCDTLLVAAGLLPEDGLCPEEEHEGVYRCGNVHIQYSLVDHVAEEGRLIGLKAAEYVLGEDAERKSAIDELEADLAKVRKNPRHVQDDDTILCCRCPKGCNLHVEKDPYDESGALAVSGNECPRGEEYAAEEYYAPKQVLTTTVKVKDADFKLIPARSTKPIPLELMADAMKMVRRIRVDSDVADGTIIKEDIFSTGADIVVTR